MKTLVKLLVVSIALMAVSCVSLSDEEKKVFDDNYYENGTAMYTESDYHIVVLDKCQYLRRSGEGTVSHKGNCNNPIHCHNGGVPEVDNDNNPFTDE